MDWFLKTTINAEEKWAFETAVSDEIQIHSNYKDYYKKLYELFELTLEGDEIFMVGWGFNLDIDLIPGKKAVKSLAEANERKVKIRLLASGQVNGSSQGAVNAINNFKGKGEKRALIDTQLLVGSDHHQKAVFIRKSSLPFLFIGGMDITNDRLNWIDAQVEIIGSGALLGLNTLEERWKSVESPFIKSIKPLVNYNVPQLLKNSGFTVQFIRTYSPIQVGNEKIENRNYAENGDFTYFNLVRKALLNCRKSIYQEDQFFESMGNKTQPIEKPQSPGEMKRSDITGNSLDPLIYSKAGQQNFKYFGIGNNYFHSSFPRYFGKNKFNSSNKNSFPALMQLGKDFNQLTKVFFHSKLWIFDDELIIIGSANYWNPSFNSEPRPGFQKNNGDRIKSELGVAFTSSKATGEAFGFPKVSYIHGLRLKLWERIRQFADPAFNFKQDQVGDFENEFNILVGDFDDKGTKRKLFEPMG